MAARHHKSLIAITNELHELVICDICFEPYDNKTRRPKFLECYHTFCSQCLFSLASNGPDNPHTILCPNCRHPTPLPKNGVDGMQTNFYIEKLKLLPVTTDQTKALSNTGGCHKHHDQPKSFFCEICRTAICRDCTILDHTKTAGHCIVNFIDAVVVHRNVLEDQLYSSRATRTQMKMAINRIESEIETLDVCRDSVMENLRSMIQTVHQQLDEGVHQVTNVVGQQYNFHQSTLLNKQRQLYRKNALIDMHIRQSETLVKTNDICEMIHMTEELKRNTEVAKLDFANVALGKESLASDMITSATSFNNSLCQLGRKYFKLLLPTNFVFNDNAVTAGCRSKITIKLLNQDRNTIPVVACFLSMKIMDPWKSSLSLKLETTEPECIVTFTPQRSGKHEISVLYLDQRLKSQQNHISVQSNNPVLIFGGLGVGNRTFNSPRGIAIDNDNCLYVADTGNGLIQKLSSDGGFMHQFRVNKDNKNLTSFMVALDLNKESLMCTEILIENNAAIKGNSLLQFSLDGKLHDAYTLNEMACPASIAVNSCGNVLLSDEQEKCVFEVDGEGKFLRRMGDFGRPGYICVDDNDNIIVPDVLNDCIYVFNPDGIVTHKFGSFGSGSGQMNTPFAVATDGENILVAEGRNSRIQVFKYDGTPVCVIESEAAPLRNPRGLAITNDGHVYVVDRDNHCVKKYRYRDMSQ